MYKPFLEARHTSLLQGLMEMEPTGWFTLMVAPSLNGSSPCGFTAGEWELVGGGGRGCSAVSGDGWNSPDDADDRREAVSAGEAGRGTLAGCMGGVDGGDGGDGGWLGTYLPPGPRTLNYAVLSLL